MTPVRRRGTVMSSPMGATRKGGPAMNWKRERITPEDREHWLRLRMEDLTSTEVAALFGISPYLTRFELHHRKRSGEVVEFEPTERMRWGTRLEDAIAAGIAEDRGWKTRRINRYMRIPDLRAGSSFDYEIVGDETAILEVKNVDGIIFAQQWEEADDGSIEAPPHIEIQVQHQLLVSGREKAYIGALIGGNRVVVLERVPDPAVQQRIIEEVGAFWSATEPPEIDYARDAAFVASLYAYAEPGKVIEDPGIGDFIQEYQAAGEDEKKAKEAKDAAKAKILEAIGDAEKVLGEGWSVSAGMVGPAEIAYTRKGYRGFRVNRKKGGK